MLKAVRPVLTEVQHGTCFYCPKLLTDANVHVDHFIPWSRWVERNRKHDAQLTASLRERGIVTDLPASTRVARWAYS